MTDIVERLRTLAGNHPDGVLEREAADEIERLRAENAHLRDLAIEANSALHRTVFDNERLRKAMQYTANAAGGLFGLANDCLREVP